MGEFYVSLFCQQFGIAYIIGRIFNVYGPRMVGTKYGQVIPEFISRIAEGEYPLQVYGDGHHTRSFCYVSDHTTLTWRILNSGMRNDIINIATRTKSRLNNWRKGSK